MCSFVLVQCMCQCSCCSSRYQAILLPQAAFDLLTAATKAQQAVIPVPALEQRKWLAIAARALVQVCLVCLMQSAMCTCMLRRKPELGTEHYMNTSVGGLG